MTIFLAALALAVLIVVGLFLRRIILDLREERRRGLNRPAAPQVMPDDRAKAFGAAGKGCLGGILLAFGPTLLFVLTYALSPVPAGERIYVASAALAAAVLAAMVWRHFRPLPSAPTFPWRNLLIFAMAGLTVAVHDDLFVKVRPTITNAIGAVLAIAALAGIAPRFGGLVDRSRVPLDDSGWRKMVVASAMSGVVMAAANEYVRRFQSEPFWVYFQVWGTALFIAAFLVFAFLVLRRHLPERQCPATPRNQISEPSNDQ